MIYILSCETIENEGGIYAYKLTKNGVFETQKYFPCDRPMYAAKCEKGLCVILRQPFENSQNSGYFFVDENLQKATEIKDTKGVVACHLYVDKEDVYIVNYASGNIVKNGKIVEQRQGKSVHPTRQSKPHTHFVGKTIDGYLAVCDLGTDALVFYDKDLQFVSEVKVPDGYGIRHLAFSKDGKYIYAVNELVPSVSIFTYANRKAELINTVKIDCKNEKANGAAIRLSNDGDYLYVSLREENEICVFKVAGDTLVLIQRIDCGGESPRDFVINKDNIIICNEKSGNAVVYNFKEGLLKDIISNITKKNVLCCVLNENNSL